MNKEIIDLLLQQRLITKRNFERKTGLSYSDFSIDKPKNDDTILREQLSSFFNLPEEVFDCDKKPNFFLKHGNLFIFIVSLLSISSLIIAYRNRFPIISITISSINMLVLLSTYFFYRKFLASILLVILFFYSVFLLGLFIILPFLDV